MFYFALCELFNEDNNELSLSVAVSFCLSSGIGFWSIYLLLCVTYSDPGIVIPLDNDFSKGFKMYCMDLDGEEKAAYDLKDPIYKNSTYY